MLFVRLFILLKSRILGFHILLLVIFLTNVNALLAQDENLSGYLYPINKKEKVYSGVGIDWILRQSDSTQFYLFGEQHGIKGIPELVRSVYLKLNESELFQLGLEMDGWITDKISEEGIEEVAAKYPHSIAFDYDGEIALMKSTEKRSEIWGLDQMITSIHPYQRLIEIAPNKNAKRLARGAFLKASLKMGQYIKQPHYEDFGAIKNAFGNDISNEAAEILDNLKASMDIYVAYRAGQRGEISKQVSVELREQFMMRQFDSYIDQNPKKKAIIKMGGAHLIKGIGPNGVETLGNYIIETAGQNKLKALSIGMFNYHDNLEFIDHDIFKHSDIILLDCKKYLKEQPDSLFSGFLGSNKALLKGYDSIILFNNSESAKNNFVSVYEREFKSSLIKQVAMGGILIILCLTLLAPLISYARSKPNKTKSHIIYGRLLLRIFVASIITIIIFGYQIYSFTSWTNKAVVMEGTISIWLYVVLFVIASYFIYRTILFLNINGKKRHKIYLIVTTTVYLSLTGFMYFWNIGGMLSF